MENKTIKRLMILCSILYLLAWIILLVILIYMKGR